MNNVYNTPAQFLYYDCAYTKDVTCHNCSLSFSRKHHSAISSDIPERKTKLNSSVTRLSSCLGTILVPTAHAMCCLLCVPVSLHGSRDHIHDVTVETVLPAHALCIASFPGVWGEGRRKEHLVHTVLQHAFNFHDILGEIWYFSNPPHSVDANFNFSRSHSMYIQVQYVGPGLHIYKSMH